MSVSLKEYAHDIQDSATELGILTENVHRSATALLDVLENPDGDFDRSDFLISLDELRADVRGLMVWPEIDRLSRMVDAMVRQSA